MANVLEIKKLRKTYPGFMLKDISFSLPEGYVMGLIGPNGAGKTSIIKLIMNLIHSDGGEISIFGMHHGKDSVAIKERIGFVYDNPSWYTHLTLKQIKNLIAPFYRSWDESRFQELITTFGLPLKKRLSTFSRGMVMKSAIAIALSHHADFIVMDEPTSGLDPVFRRELLDLFYEILQSEKKSILFSTHITSDLEKIADFITFILEGTLIFTDTKDNVTENYAIIKGGLSLVDNLTEGLFKGMRKTAFGFEALTDNVKEVKKRYGRDVVVDSASLEDIMYFSKLRSSDDTAH
ncbi:ABC transporter ATP-binding protein [bacterium]|nr:ABC transporter ATP-binding protein [bacterium]